MTDPWLQGTLQSVMDSAFRSCNLGSGFKQQASSSKLLTAYPGYDRMDLERKIMTKKLKEEYQQGGSKRHVILQKAVEYLKDPRFGLQGDKQSFLMDKLGLSSSEYLQCLNDAAGGACWQ